MQKTILIILISALGLSACATPNTLGPQGTKSEITAETAKQKSLVLNAFLQEGRRINAIGARIQMANIDLCPDKGWETGFDVWSTDVLDDELADGARNSFGLSKQPKIYGIFPVGPAKNSNLKIGDLVLSVNETKTSTVSGFYSALNKIKDKTVTLTIQRGEDVKSVTLNRAPSCGYNFSYDISDMEVNAYADGKNIVVSRGMGFFAKSDNDMAVVIGHELGHNIMKHMDKSKQNATMAGLAGLLLDIAAASQGVSTHMTNDMMAMGAQAYSVDFESEADYVGLYLTARAGYPIANAPLLWRRMATEVSSGAIYTRDSHPTSPERFVALEKTIAEINKKRAKGQVLKPNAAE